MSYNMRQFREYDLFYHSGLLTTDFTKKSEVDNFIKSLQEHPYKDFMVNIHIKDVTKRHPNNPPSESDIESIKFIVFYLNLLLNTNLGDDNLFNNTVNQLEKYQLTNEGNLSFKKRCIRDLKKNYMDLL